VIRLFPNAGGWLEVVCGPMFSGKSEELIRRLRRAEIAGQRALIVKPLIDDRYDVGHVVSHAGAKMRAVTATSGGDVRRLAAGYAAVGIDEAQFFDEGLVDVAQRLADQGKRVIVAGLDKDFRGMPFGPIPALMAVAEDVTKTLAICMRCGSPANNTQRLVESEELVVVGAQGVYEARCRRCFEPPARG